MNNRGKACKLRICYQGNKVGSRLENEIKDHKDEKKKVVQVLLVIQKEAENRNDTRIKAIQDKLDEQSLEKKNLRKKTGD